MLNHGINYLFLGNRLCKLHGLTQRTFITLRFLRVRKLGLGLAGEFLAEGPLQAAIKMLSRVTVTRLDGEGSLSKLTPGATGRAQVLSGCWLETLASCHVEPSTGVFKIWKPDTSKVRNQEKEQSEVTVFSQSDLGNGISFANSVHYK